MNSRITVTSSRENWHADDLTISHDRDAGEFIVDLRNNSNGPTDRVVIPGGELEFVARWLLVEIGAVEYPDSMWEGAPDDIDQCRGCNTVRDGVHTLRCLAEQILAQKAGSGVIA